MYWYNLFLDQKKNIETLNSEENIMKSWKNKMPVCPFAIWQDA